MFIRMDIMNAAVSPILYVFSKMYHMDVVNR